MISVKGLNRRVDRLFKQADEIQEKHKRFGEATDKELRKMNLMYNEASTITLTLEAVKNDIVKLIDS